MLEYLESNLAESDLKFFCDIEGPFDKVKSKYYGEYLESNFGVVMIYK